MKNINELGWYTVDNKIILMVGNQYTGNPQIFCTYDVLICSKEILNRFRSVLIADHLRKNGWEPHVRYI